MGLQEGRGNACYIHLTLLPYIPTAGELKTKPTQHSVKELREIGIQPDVLLCRADRPIPEDEKAKIGLFCNVQREAVIECLDADSIYKIPSIVITSYSIHYTKLYDYIDGILVVLGCTDLSFP